MEKPMGKRNAGPLPAETGRLKAAVQSWRDTRAKVGPMPADLWQRAMSLAAKHGICRVARAIGVDYSALRERLEVREVPSAEPAFLEIPATMVLAGTETGEAQVEIARCDGSRLRMRGPALDAAAIVAAFMGRS